MLLLLKDFSRRWVLVFPLVMFFAVMAAVTEYFALFLWVMLAGPAVLSWDGLRGALKVEGTLPLPKKVLANVVWFEAVVLFPLVCAPIVLVIQVFLIVTGPESFGLLVETAFFYVLGLGLASFLFLLLMLQPLAPTGDFRDDAKGAAFGGIWGACFGGSMLLGMRVQALHSSPWGVAALLLAALLIAAGHLFAGRFISVKAGARTGTTTSSSARGLAVRVRMPGRWAGFTTPWLWEVGFAFIMGAAMVGFTLFFSYFSSSPAFSREAAGAVSPFMVIFLTVIVAAARPMTWLAGVRAFRVLPLSRWQLTLLYLSLPCVLSCAVLGFALAVQFFMVGKVVAPQLLVILLPLLGVCFLCNVLYLRTGSMLVLVVPWAAIIIATIARPVHAVQAGGGLAPAALICLAFVAVGVVYLHHLLGNSSDAYRHKPFVPGQMPLQR